jgi:hypothetical protein
MQIGCPNQGRRFTYSAFCNWPGNERPAPDGQKDDFNYAANWMKHDNDPEEVEIEELEVKLGLYRAISKYRAVYGIGTPEMADLFPWACNSSRPS